MKEYCAVVSVCAKAHVSSLEAGFDVFYLPPSPRLQTPVASHADMLLCAVDSTFFVSRDYYEDNGELLRSLADSCGAKLCVLQKEFSPEYPRDIPLNVLLCGSYAFSLEEHTAPEIIRYLSHSGYTHVRVKQGYSACSSLSLGGKAVVTADPTVLNGCTSIGIDTLEISPEGIELPGYDCGFIGGCSGVCEDTVYFTGDLDTHPDAKNIREFLASHGYSSVSIFSGPLTDVGGIKFIKKQ